MRRLPVHPLLLGAWPVLALWSGNRTEVLPRDVLPVLGVVLAVTVAAWLLASLVLRDARRGAIVATAATVAGQFAGHLGDGAAWLHLTLVAAAVLAAALLVARVGKDRTGSVTFVANACGAVVLVLAAAPILSGLVAAPSIDREPADVSAAGTPPTRDIVYIVPDRYGRADMLEELYGFDNQPFLSFLTQRGFQVADQSLTNYNKTAHAMAAAWDLNYLDELVAQLDDTASGDWGPLYDRLRDHRLGEIVTALGYEYVHLGSWWGPTSDAASADVVLNHRSHSEFAQVYAETTVWPAVQQLVRPEEAELSVRERVRNHTLFQFEQLHRLNDLPADRPRFVLAHVLVPHEPYVFEPDGAWVPADLEQRRSRIENFNRQLAYTNLRLEELVRDLLSGPEDEHPIIIIQADEGPHPAEYIRQAADFHWPTATEDELAEKMKVISALYLPGVDVEVPRTLSPVNTFRLVLDAYHGTGFGLLEDRAFVFRDEHNLYEFHEVTDQLR